MKEAVCTWGDGPDVILTLTDDKFILYEDPIIKDFIHGYVTKGSMDLTADEALTLGSELQWAGRNAKNLDRLAQEADEVELKRKKGEE